MDQNSIKYCPHCGKELNVSEEIEGEILCSNCKSVFKINHIINVPHKAKPEIKNKLFFLIPIFLKGLIWLLVIPFFIFVHKTLPDFNWIFQLDRILIFLVILLIVLFITIKIKHLVILFSVFFLLAISFGSFKNIFGFQNLYNDYKILFYTIIDSPNPKEIILAKLYPIENEARIINSIDYENPEVRNFAVAITLQNFKEYTERTDYRTIIQCFAVFKEINSKWNYVNDPESRNYFAKASESVVHLSGDCDDHSILMAACIKAIGGTSRIIHTTGHLYPEILIGSKKDLEVINYLIKRKLFPVESKGMSLNYHINENNQVWLNLDYTAKYPGGPFMNEEILGVLNFE